MDVFTLKTVSIWHLDKYTDTIADLIVDKLLYRYLGYACCSLQATRLPAENCNKYRNKQ